MSSIIDRNRSVILWSFPIFATVYGYQIGTYGFEHSVFVMLTIIAILLAFIRDSIEWE